MPATPCPLKRTFFMSYVMAGTTAIQQSCNRCSSILSIQLIPRRGGRRDLAPCTAIMPLTNCRWRYLMPPPSHSSTPTFFSAHSVVLANPFRVCPNPTLAICLTNFAADKQDNFLLPPPFLQPLSIHLRPTVARTVAQIINDARYRALFST